MNPAKVCYYAGVLGLCGIAIAFRSAAVTAVCAFVAGWMVGVVSGINFLAANIAKRSGAR